MAKLTAIALWFDDGTRYDIDPNGVQSIFTGQGAAGKCGHHGPYETPGPQSPVHGPYPDKNPPKGGGTNGAPADSGSMSLMNTGGGCYWVNGTIVCP